MIIISRFLLLNIADYFILDSRSYKSESALRTKKKAKYQPTHTVSKREKKIHCFWHKNSISSSKKARKKIASFDEI